MEILELNTGSFQDANMIDMHKSNFLACSSHLFCQKAEVVQIGRDQYMNDSA